MSVNVNGCSKEFEGKCVYSHICDKNCGYIMENSFKCDNFVNSDNFLDNFIEHLAKSKRGKNKN